MLVDNIVPSTYKGKHMSNLEKLLAAGAESAGGDLLLRSVVVGRFRGGDMTLTEEGLAELEVDDVVIKSETPKPAKSKKTPEADPAPESDISAELDALGL
jgi:hypothetical protein